jgi:hypothetical protein
MRPCVPFYKLQLLAVCSDSVKKIKDPTKLKPQLYELEDTDIAHTYLNKPYVVGDCATICRLHERVGGQPCTAFAIQNGNDCWPLFTAKTEYTQKVMVTETTAVYSIAGCYSD